MFPIRVLFTIAALASMALWVSLDYRRAARIRGGQAPWFPWVAASIVVTVLLVLAVRMVVYFEAVRQYRQTETTAAAVCPTSFWACARETSWTNLSEVDAGAILIALIGAVFGAFTGKLVLGLFTRSMDPKRAFYGAGALLILSIAYSLPLYQREIAGLLRDSGLSTLKVSVAEISVEASLAARGTPGSDSAGGQATGSPSLSIARVTDPTPGIQALAADFPSDSSRKSQSVTQIDKDYVDHFEKHVGSQPEFEASTTTLVCKAETLLAPVATLGNCLVHYNKIIRDSQLLLIDIKPTIAALFAMHRTAIDSFGALYSGKQPEQLFFGQDDRNSMKEGIKATIISAQKTLAGRKSATGPCDPALLERKELTSPVRIAFNEPYTELALADLLIAHGAPDEAVDVLAEWINGQQKLDSQSASPSFDEWKSMPAWFKVRVLAKLQGILGNITQKQARPFETVLEMYQAELTKYFKSARDSILLEDIPDACKAWANGHDAVVERKRRIAFLLVGTEIDSLRTKLNFVPEITSFEALVKLGDRAAFLMQQKSSCLPESLDVLETNYEYRKAVLADGQVVAGLVALAAADRMQAIGTSSGERERAITLQKQGENWLRTGYVDLRPIWEVEQERQTTKPLQDRIFNQSPWEASANLASRMIARLH